MLNFAVLFISSGARREEKTAGRRGKRSGLLIHCADLLEFKLQLVLFCGGGGHAEA
jgi:hypothetical protein